MLNISHILASANDNPLLCMNIHEVTLQVGENSGLSPKGGEILLLEKNLVHKVDSFE